MKKTYEVPGMMEWHPVFRAGRTRIQVSFSGGHLCCGGSSAASYETSDPVLQTIIERSDAYRAGKIRLRGVSGEAPRAVAPAMPAVTKSACRDGCKVKEYENLGLASDFLHYDMKVPLEALSSESACIEEGKKLGYDIRFIKK